MYNTISQFIKSIANGILRALFSPVLKEIHTVEAKVANLSAQVDSLIQAEIKADLKNRHQHIDLKQDLHTRLLNEANDKHDSQLNYLKHTYQSQNFSVYAQFGETLRQEFKHLLGRTLGDDFQIIQHNAEQLFTDILIGHLTPGGIWRLHHDFAQFANPQKDSPSRQSPTKLQPLSISASSAVVSPA